jgi:hypothetical protein
MGIRRNGAGLAVLGASAMAFGAAFLPAAGASAAPPAPAQLICPQVVGPGPSILPGPPIDGLNGVATLSAKQAWAVGTEGDSPFIDQFNGSKWSSVDAAALNVIGQFHAAAKFPGGAWAVGGGGPSDAAQRPFIVRLTGAKSGTKVQRTPTPKLAVGQLLTVSATSAKDAWAGGFLGKDASVLLHWNGKAWSRASFPGNGIVTATLAISSKNVWVIDVADKTGSQVWNWNGKKWRQTAIPALNGKAGYTLRSLSATSPKDLWAVGSFLDSDVVSHTVSVHWNGSKWSLVKTPVLRQTDGPALAAVAASAPDDAWAVGENVHFPAVIEHWDGSSWTAVTSPSCGALNAISLAPGGKAWAVGTIPEAQDTTPFILLWTGNAWKTVPTPTH